MSLIRKLLPLFVLAAGVGIAWLVVATGPKAKREPPAPPVSVVEVQTLQPRDYAVALRSQGSVAPRTQSSLVAEVAGKVLEISPRFLEGGFFEKGDTLLRIDPRDYQNQVTIAEADYAQQQVLLAQERARAEQARRDWEKLGERGQPSELVLRKPQLASVEAAAAAARAKLAQARLELERTRVVAPFAGRVLEKKVDVGQYVTKGTPLATIFAVDYVEVKLPLSAEQLAWLNIPEHYRGEAAQAPGPRVTLTPANGDRATQWEGRIVRTSGALDSKSRQLFVVAQVDDPYAARADRRPPLKIGTFVEADIEGKRLSGVFVVPRSALREGREVLLAVDGKLERRAVNVLWSDERDAVIGGGLAAGERLIVTPVSFAVNGAPIRIQGESAPAAGG